MSFSFDARDAKRFQVLSDAIRLGYLWITVDGTIWVECPVGDGSGSYHSQTFDSISDAADWCMGRV